MAENSNEELMHLFRYCNNLIRRNYHQSVHGKVGTHHGQGKIFWILREDDGIGQKDLADRLQIRPASLSELLDKMQGSGWIKRQCNEQDRRKVNIYLTEEGMAISEQMIAARREMVNDVFGILTDEERACLDHVLSKLISRMELLCEEKEKDLSV